MLNALGTVFLGSLTTNEFVSGDPATSLILSLSSVGTLCGSYLISRPHPYLIYSTLLLAPVTYKNIIKAVQSPSQPTTAKTTNSTTQTEQEEPSNLDGSTYEHIDNPSKPQQQRQNSPPATADEPETCPMKPSSKYFTASAFIVMIIGVFGEFYL